MHNVALFRFCTTNHPDILSNPNMKVQFCMKWKFMVVLNRQQQRPRTLSFTLETHIFNRPLENELTINKRSLKDSVIVDIISNAICSRVNVPARSNSSSSCFFTESMYEMEFKWAPSHQGALYRENELFRPRDFNERLLEMFWDFKSAQVQRITYL